MKVSTKSRKRLLYFTANNTNKGFTLPGLLGRILMYGSVFVTLLLPFYDFRDNSFLGAGSRERTAEARQNIGAMNRAQQAYFLEKNVFSDSIVALGAGIKTDTENYSYRILSPMVPVQAIDQSAKAAPFSQNAIMVAQAKKPQYKSFIGVVHTAPDPTGIRKTDVLIMAAICEIESWNALPSAMQIVTNDVVQCPSKSKNLIK